MKNIAIDGPAGAGKSTIAKLVAGAIGGTYVDTGALYRGIALHTLNCNVDISEENQVANILNDCLITMKHVDGLQKVFLNGEDVSTDIRREEVGNAASKISAYSAVRKKLLSLQREMAASTNVVMDGRDIGTVVLPDCHLKIFLTASVEERADRRYKELLNKGEKPELEKIKQDIIIRDKQDTEREIAPLRQAEDAVLIDSSNLTIDEVVEKIVSLY